MAPYFSGYQPPSYERPSFPGGMTTDMGYRGSGGMPGWMQGGFPSAGDMVMRGRAQPGSGRGLWGPRQGAPPPGGGGDPGVMPYPPGDVQDDNYWRVNPITGGKWDDTQTVRQLISRMISGGFYNPFGTPGYRDMYEQAGQRQVQDAYGRAETAADVRGLTPEQAQYARTMAGIGASGGAARGYADFSMQDALSNRDFLRQLIGKHYDFNYTVRP